MIRDILIIRIVLELDNFQTALKCCLKDSEESFREHLILRLYKKGDRL